MWVARHTDRAAAIAVNDQSVSYYYSALTGRAVFLENSIYTVDAFTRVSRAEREQALTRLFGHSGPSAICSTAREFGIDYLVALTAATQPRNNLPSSPDVIVVFRNPGVTVLSLASCRAVRPHRYDPDQPHTCPARLTAGTEGEMTSFWRDVRYALRVFARERGFTAMAVLTLALGLGSSTAVYSVVDAVLLRPLPYAPSDRVVQIVQEFGRGGAIRDPAGSLTSAIVIRDVFEAWRASTTTLDGLGIFGFRSITLAGQPEPLRLRASNISPRILSMLGTAPLAGAAVR